MGYHYYFEIFKVNVIVVAPKSKVASNFDRLDCKYITIFVQKLAKRCEKVFLRLTHLNIVFFTRASLNSLLSAL